MKKHITWINVLLSALLSFMIMVLIWSSYNSKVLILFMMALAGAETFVQFRWRLAVVCPHCGFDPVMYVKSRKALVKRVKTRLTEIEESPQYLLSNHNPLVSLPKKKAEPGVLALGSSSFSPDHSDTPEQVTSH